MIWAPILIVAYHNNKEEEGNQILSFCLRAKIIIIGTNLLRIFYAFGGHGKYKTKVCRLYKKKAINICMNKTKMA